MNILVLGSGGREHAIAWALAKSPRCDKLYVAPGNGGTAGFAENVADLAADDGQAVLAFARAHDIGLVAIGPEAPLVAGVADVLRDAGVAVFGPDAEGAQLEGSKTFCKEFMMRNDLPTAEYLSTDDEEAAHAYIDEKGAPIVVKADGLAAGKGVVVAATADEAHAAVTECFSGAFGSAGNTVVIEECLTGPECSMLAFVTAGRAYCMAPSQDHKRAYDGDEGPNTGGMGAYSPVPIVTDDELAQMEDIMARAAAATAREFEHDYRGVLYGGFMLTPAGPKLLEYNARFGDPETQVVLPRLESDLVEVMLAVAEGRAHDIELAWADKWAVTVVLASEGYPRAYEKGKVITGIDAAEALGAASEPGAVAAPGSAAALGAVAASGTASASGTAATLGAVAAPGAAATLGDVKVYHAGTAVRDDGALVTAGGRVLNVTAMGPTFEAARDLAYQACDAIHFEGKQNRTDIGARALRGRDAWS